MPDAAQSGSVRQSVEFLSGSTCDSIIGVGSEIRGVDSFSFSNGLEAGDGGAKLIVPEIIVAFVGPGEIKIELEDGKGRG